MGVVNLGDLTIANLHFENYKAFGTKKDKARADNIMLMYNVKF